MLTSTDEKYLRLAIEVAQRARAHGNHPFGSVLVDAAGNLLLEAENTVVTERDITGHAETNLARLAWHQYDPEFLSTCTLYTSTEPCPMCAGAIYWSNIGRVVFALSSATFYNERGESTKESKLALSSGEVFARGSHKVQLVGPALEDEASVVHEGFWD